MCVLRRAEIRRSEQTSARDGSEGKGEREQRREMKRNGERERERERERGRERWERERGGGGGGSRGMERGVMKKCSEFLGDTPVCRPRAAVDPRKAAKTHLPLSLPHSQLAWAVQVGSRFYDTPVLFLHTCMQQIGEWSERSWVGSLSDRLFSAPFFIFYFFLRSLFFSHPVAAASRYVNLLSMSVPLVKGNVIEQVTDRATVCVYRFLLIVRQRGHDVM